MMATVAVSLSLAWLWRCEIEGTIVSGSDLRVVDADSHDSLISLCDGPRKSEVSRDSLRHACGGRVVPVAPHSVNSGPIG